MSVPHVGIVGAGSIVSSMHLPVLTSMKQVRVGWIADASAERAASLAAAYRLPRAVTAATPDDLPEADAVLLAIPVGPRTAYYETLAKRKIAVLAEKPFALNTADHERFLSLYEPHRIGCGYMRRMYASTMLLRRIVAEEWFGTLRRMRIKEGGRLTRTGVDASYQDLGVEEGGGILINLASHTLDLAFWITGASDYAIQSQRVVFDGETDRKAEAEIVLKGVGGNAGAAVALDFACSWLDRQDNQTELTFDHAVVAAGTNVAAPVLVRRRGTTEPAAKLVPLERGATTSNQAFYLEWVEFLRGVAERAPSAMSAGSCMATTRLIDELLARGRAQCRPA